MYAISVAHHTATSALYTVLCWLCLFQSHYESFYQLVLNDFVCSFLLDNDSIDSRINFASIICSEGTTLFTLRHAVRAVKVLLEGAMQWGR